MINLSVLSGSGPPETSNSPNSPGPIRTPGLAVQVIVLTASEISASSVLIGVASLTLVTEAVQPGTDLVFSDAKGWSSGNLTASFTVPAVASSVGTRKVILV